ncbi:uncharacterized protein LOC144864476 isoform X2 [Branchiostoma floridae x Branchiostoma japonicum]
MVATRVQDKVATRKFSGLRVSLTTAMLCAGVLLILPQKTSAQKSLLTMLTDNEDYAEKIEEETAYEAPMEGEHREARSAPPLPPPRVRRRLPLCVRCVCVRYCGRRHLFCCKRKCYITLC